MSKVIAVVGPTASGKSALGIAIAGELGGEIVNADAMQCYSGMDIGTAKVPVDARGDITHHLLDLWRPDEDASVADYQRAARAVVSALLARGTPVIVVGGSGLYVSALIDDLEFPGTDASVRARLEADLDSAGARALHDRLTAIDPEAARHILPTNGRRIVRALEVIELTGQPFRAQLRPQPVYDSVRIGLRPPWGELDERIALRVEQMWADGLVDEVRRLNESGLSRTAERALGYSQVLAFLRGECDEQQAKDDTIVATRRFARRQVRWLRRDPLVQWVEPEDAIALVTARPA